MWIEQGLCRSGSGSMSKDSAAVLPRIQESHRPIHRVLTSVSIPVANLVKQRRDPDNSCKEAGKALL